MATKKSERSYGLSAEEINQLTEQYRSTKKLPNPHRSGAYGFTIAALVSLGINKPHPLRKVHEAFKKLAGNEWYRAWANKEARNEETGKDASERFIQNLQVLQRTKDYGRRLLEVGQKVLKTKGAVIDLSRDEKGNLFVMLNTRSAQPRKPGRAGQSERKSEAVSKRPRPAAKTKPRRKAKGKGGRKAKGETPTPAPNPPASTAS